MCVLEISDDYRYEPLTLFRRLEWLMVLVVMLVVVSGASRAGFPRRLVVVRPN